MAVSRREDKRAKPWLCGLIGLVGCSALWAACTAWPGPDSSLVEDVDIQARITEAVRQGGGTVELPHGRYLVDRPLLIDRAEGLIIEGNGSVLVYTFAGKPNLPMTFATIIQDSQNVTLRNLTIDFDPLPYTQGTIVALDPEGTWCDIRVHNGYRSDVEFLQFDVNKHELSLHLFDPQTRQLKVGSSFLFPNRITSSKAGTLRFWFEDDPDPEDHYHMQQGDYVATAAWRAMPLAIRNSEGTRLENVTIWAAGGDRLADRPGAGATSERGTGRPAVVGLSRWVSCLLHAAWANHSRLTVHLAGR